VLDLDETLIHYYEENGKEKYRERPGAYEFIQKMADHYELVIFTAGL
jgi:predicted HAD superfamily phosphohydrolase YqeG